MTNYRTITIDGFNVFYREAGSQNASTLVLLHGFPASSHMYQGLIEALSDTFHLVAPDFLGFGNSDSPTVDEFEYSFDHLAEVTEHFLQSLGLSRLSLYVHDYGAPIGFRIATKHPAWIETLIIQNGNAYEEGLTSAFEPARAFWRERTEATEAAMTHLLTHEAITFAYAQGTRHPEQINPDNVILDLWNLQRPGSRATQLELLYDYRTNLERYPEWQAYFRQYQPPTLVVWGKHDPFFSPEGALAYQRDLNTIEVHLLETGHFALEEDVAQIAALITRFLPAHVTQRELSR